MKCLHPGGKNDDEARSSQSAADSERNGPIARRPRTLPAEKAESGTTLGGRRTPRIRPPGRVAVYSPGHGVAQEGARTSRVDPGSFVEALRDRPGRPE